MKSEENGIGIYATSQCVCMNTIINSKIANSGLQLK